MFVFVNDLIVFVIVNKTSSVVAGYGRHGMPPPALRTDGPWDVVSMTCNYGGGGIP